MFNCLCTAEYAVTVYNHTRYTSLYTLRIKWNKGMQHAKITHTCYPNLYIICNSVDQYYNIIFPNKHFTIS